MGRAYEPAALNSWQECTKLWGRSTARMRSTVYSVKIFANPWSWRWSRSHVRNVSDCSGRLWKGNLIAHFHHPAKGYQVLIEKEPLFDLYQVSSFALSCANVPGNLEWLDLLKLSLYLEISCINVLNPGKCSYPYSSLRAGFKWPTDVDPTAREEHLTCTDFLQVFGISYDDYVQLPLWKRQRLKRDNALF